jgi:hypothetical protein
MTTANKHLVVVSVYSIIATFYVVHVIKHPINDISTISQEADNLHSNGIQTSVVVDSTELQNKIDALQQENSGLSDKIKKLQANSKNPIPESIANVSGTIEHVGSGPECVLLGDDSLRLELHELRFGTSAGNHVILGTIKALRVRGAVEHEIGSVDISTSTANLYSIVDHPGAYFVAGPSIYLSPSGTGIGASVGYVGLSIFGVSAVPIIGIGAGLSGMYATFSAMVSF